MADDNNQVTDGEQVVTPWEAKAAEGEASIDYEKLISRTNLITVFSSLLCSNFTQDNLEVRG